MLDNKKRILCRCENENNRTFMMLLPFDYCLKVHKAHFKLASPISGQVHSRKKIRDKSAKKSTKLVYSVELHNYIRS